MRFRMADGSWPVGAVDSVAFLVESNPTRTDRVAASRRDNNAGVVAGGVCQPGDDFELADGAGADRGAHCNLKDANDGAVFEDRQFPVRNADYDLPANPLAFRINGPLLWLVPRQIRSVPEPQPEPIPDSLCFVCVPSSPPFMRLRRTKWQAESP